MKIKNKAGEEIDFVVEGSQDAKITIIFVHGFGTNKNEGTLFLNISSALKESFRIVRFDFTGYGESGGEQTDVTLSKEASDLGSVIEFTRNNYGNDIYLLGMSLGCYVIALLSPENIKTTLFVSPPDQSQDVTIERLKNRIRSRAGVSVNEDGITIYPRSSGEVQRIEPGFWRDLKKFNAEAAISAYSYKTRLITIVPMQDDIFERNDISFYDKHSISCIRLKGNHAFTDTEDRKALISEIKCMLETAKN